MKRKIIFSFCVCFAIFFTANAQIHIGNFFGSFKKKNFKTFKNHKITYFIFYENVGYSKEEYKKLLNDTWTLTPYEIINEEEYQDSLKEGVSYARANIFSVR